MLHRRVRKYYFKVSIKCASTCYFLSFISYFTPRGDQVKRYIVCYMSHIARQSHLMCYTWLAMKRTLICWEQNVHKRNACVCYHENVEWLLIMRAWVSICVVCAWFVASCSRAHYVTLLYLRSSRPTSCLGVSHDNEEIRFSENEPDIVDSRENRWFRWVQHSDPPYKCKSWGSIWQHPVRFPSNVTLW